MTAAGLVLLAAALAASQGWLDRHFLPSFLMPRAWYVRIETGVRLAVAVFGVVLIVRGRAIAASFTRRRLGRVVPVVLAVVIALAAAGLVLGRSGAGSGAWLDTAEEPLRQADARLGWTFVPARTGAETVGGRRIEYALDEAGCRVARAGQKVDPEDTTVLFTGESIVFGDGLTYEESVPAQVEAMLGIQSANLGVYGFSTSQMYIKLQTSLPRFRRPAAVVALFMTALLGRNLDDDRPHMGPGLVWEPARPRAKLVSLATLLVPFRRSVTVERGIAVTREVLTAVVNLARSHGAVPLIAVPQIGPEAEPERVLRRRILDEPGLPYVLISLDPAWHRPWNRHPDARAAHEMAVAIAARLRENGLSFKQGVAKR